jgi:hypothetical protein
MRERSRCRCEQRLDKGGKEEGTNSASFGGGGIKISESPMEESLASMARVYSRPLTLYLAR